MSRFAKASDLVVSPSVDFNFNADSQESLGWVMYYPLNPRSSYTLIPPSVSADPLGKNWAEHPLLLCV